MNGKIIKGIGGFYYVHVQGDGVYACRARGIFRLEKRKPLVGDDVEMTVTDKKDREGSVDTLLPRRNALIRPAAANVDQALVVFAVKQPQPNFNLLDRFLIYMREQRIPALICFNKTDLADDGEKEKLRRIYEGSGCTLLFVSTLTGEGLDALREALSGRTTIMAGPSGAGKSSLTNRLQPSAQMETGDLSRKLERGRHTTRHTELIWLWEDTYLMDTPGFTSLYLPEIKARDLPMFYPDFAPFVSDCRFQGCMHLSEPDCAVKEAVDRGEADPVRYENYTLLAKELLEREKNRYR